MAVHVKCRIHKTIWERHKAGRYDSTRATCSVCNNSTSSYGSGDKSVNRCLVLLKNSCPIGANHFYVADVVKESRKYKGTTSSKTYKDGKEFLEFDKGKSTVSFSSAKTPQKNNNDSSSESETIYVRAVNNDNNYSRPIIVHRPFNQPELPKQFVLRVCENAFDGGDVVLNTELNLYAEYKLGFLNNILKGFRKALDYGYCIIVEQTKNTQGLLKQTQEEKDLITKNNETQKVIEEKTQKTVSYLNKCVQQYSNQIEWWRIIYSLEGWAEYFATSEYDTVVSDYAPKLIEKLEILKENVDNDRRPFEEDIDFLIKKYSLDIEEAKLHLKIEPYL